MKKNLFGVMTLLVGLVLMFALVGCGDDGDPSSPPGGNGGGSGNGDDNSIVISSITHGWNNNTSQAFVRINFRQGSTSPVYLQRINEEDNVSAATAGFTTTDSRFTLLDISAWSGITVNFDGTEQNYGQINHIEYTKPANPVLKFEDGTPVESFSHSIPYNNQYTGN